MKKFLGVTALVAAIVIANQTLVNASQFDYLQSKTVNSPAVLTPAEAEVTTSETTTPETTTSVPYVQDVSTPAAYGNKVDIMRDMVGDAEPNNSFGQNITNAQAPGVVDKIGKKLMADSAVDKSVSFVFSAEDTVNAYNDSQGNVFVFRGLMDYCDDEAELAFIIGHELGHAVDYHVAKGMAANVARNVGEKTASHYANRAISSKVSGKLANFGISSTAVTNKAINTAGEMAETKYSRTHENDADLQSVDFLVKSGYNPLAGVSVLYKIGENYSDLFADHPSTDKRVVTIFKYVKEKYPEYAAKGYDSKAYQEAVKKYRLY